MNTQTQSTPTPTLTEAEFYALPDNEQRVQIAKDCLTQLNEHKFVATRRVYVLLNRRDYIPAGSVQSRLQNPAVTCQVCAKGGLLAAKVLNYNKLTFNTGKSLRNEEVSEGLAGIFDQYQLDLIENAFENRMENGNDRASDPELYRASCMYDNEFDDQELYDRDYDAYNAHVADQRLRDICRNIIRNNGTFVVSDGPVPAYITTEGN